MMRALSMTALLVLGAAAAGCDTGRTDTRTFELAHLDPEAAAELIRPYIPDAAVMVRESQPRVITVAASPARLEQIADLVKRYDVPAPDVRLSFQLVEADGFTDADPAIADVEAVLRDLFRFNGYRLAAEAMVTARSRSATMQQLLATGNVPLTLSVQVGEISRANGNSAVDLSVSLDGRMGTVLSTRVVVPGGQTVVLGAARPLEDRGALILVVRPVIE
ncbi:MAG TPA: hypothetical protein VFZ69_11155 [Longimicrobiales bacterium]